MTQNLPPYTTPLNLNALSEQQRDRALEHLQGLYANGTLGQAEFERRLDAVLSARDRVELGQAMRGLARIAPVALTRPAPGLPTPAENVGAGLVHLSGIFTSFLAPVIVRTVATPGSRLWWEASRAFSLQLTAFVAGGAAFILTMVLGLGGGLMSFGWVAWMVATIWASVRAFNGQSGTGPFEKVLIAKPQAPAPRLGYTR